jgi:hypothetical protein
LYCNWCFHLESENQKYSHKTLRFFRYMEALEDAFNLPLCGLFLLYLSAMWVAAFSAVTVCYYLSQPWKGGNYKPHRCYGIIYWLHVRHISHQMSFTCIQTTNMIVPFLSLCWSSKEQYYYEFFKRKTRTAMCRQFLSVFLPVFSPEHFNICV